MLLGTALHCVPVEEAIGYGRMALAAARRPPMYSRLDFDEVEMDVEQLLPFHPHVQVLRPRETNACSEVIRCCLQMLSK